MEHTERIVERHDLAIEAIKENISEIKETLKDNSEKLGQLTELMARQEIMFEKLTTVDSNFKESISRIHKRIDKVEEATSIKKNPILQEHEKRISALEGTQKWVTRTVFSILITGIIMTIVIVGNKALKGF